MLFQIPVWVIFGKGDVKMLSIIKYYKAIGKGPFCLFRQFTAVVVIAITVNSMILIDKTQKNVLFRCVAAEIICKDGTSFFPLYKPLTFLLCHARNVSVISKNILCPAEQNPVRWMKTNIDHLWIAGIIVTN